MRKKRKNAYDRGGADYRRRGSQAKIHDRQVKSLPINAVVTMVVVDDPYEPGAKITTLRSLRDDPLAEMLSRNYIDQAQFEAGRLWQKYFERAAIGTVRAIDPAKEAVDGGRLPDPLPDGRMYASDQIAAADRSLGMDRGAIVRDVLWHGLSITQCAARRGMLRQIDRRNISARFKDSLEKLAKLWKLA